MTCFGMEAFYSSMLHMNTNQSPSAQHTVNKNTENAKDIQCAYLTSYMLMFALF